MKTEKELSDRITRLNARLKNVPSVSEEINFLNYYLEYVQKGRKLILHEKAIDAVSQERWKEAMILIWILET